MSSTPSTRPITILLVDDEVELLRLLREILELHGFVVLTARDAVEAQSLAAHTPFDVAVIEYSVCMKDRVCVRKLLPGVRCLIHSGNPDLAERPDCLGIEAVVPKPIHPDKLVAAIRDCLQNYPTQPIRP